ncbi:MAG: amidohydrolase family protein, partial [Gammaproteobacteria bacterium]|nr:amidohydrolase family protein [Gammaproteobacteria bacterium]
TEVPGPRILEARPAADAADPAAWLVTVAGDMNSGMEQRDRVEQWQQQGVPVLAETWQVALGSGASLLLGAAALPGSSGGHQYRDMKLAAGSNEPITIVSGLADAQTPGLDALLSSRQAGLLGGEFAPVRRFAQPPRLNSGKTTVVLGSKPNGLPPGLGLHAEFRALAAAGLTPEQALRAAGVNAASALGVGLQLGRIAVGSLADLVIVDGDPLADIDDALNVVGVVRNGRFFSTIGLIDRIGEPASVELFDKPRKKSGWRRAPL